MQLLFPQGSITGIGQHQVYHTLWHVYQYRSCWVLCRQQGQTVVLFLPGEAGQVLRFLTAGDVRDGGCDIAIARSPLPEGLLQSLPADAVPLGTSPESVLQVGHPFHATSLVDSLIDGEDPRCVPWAQRRAYPLTSLWFGISFHDHVPTPAPMRLAGRGAGPYEVGCTALPDWEGTDVLGCCVIDVSAKAPLTLSGGATLLVRHEVRRRPDDHVAAAMACITSLVECTRGWNH